MKAILIGSIGVALLALLHIGNANSQQLTNNSQVSRVKSSINNVNSNGNVVTAKPTSSPNHLTYTVVANPYDVIQVTLEKMDAEGVYENVLSFEESLSSDGLSKQHHYDKSGNYRLVLEDKSNNTTATHTIIVSDK